MSCKFTQTIWVLTKHLRRRPYAYYIWNFDVLKALKSQLTKSIGKFEFLIFFKFSDFEKSSLNRILENQWSKSRSRFPFVLDTYVCARCGTQITTFAFKISSKGFGFHTLYEIIKFSYVCKSIEFIESRSLL